MENFGQSTVLVRALANRGVFDKDPFVLVDIGSRGGIDPAWKLFGGNLVAFGFDPNASECERLQAAESSPEIRYVPAFVGLPPSDPFLERVGGQLWSRNPWDRLSAARAVENRRGNVGAVRGPKKDLTWDHDRYVERDKTVVLSEFLSATGISHVDFVKVDVDGEDLIVLTSLQDHLDDWGTLGLSVEVNYFGSARAEDNTFHNVDRLLKSRDFEIFDVSSRRYSTSALPYRFVGSSTGPTRTGRMLQGDATYLRDLADPAMRATQEWSASKVLKLCALFDLFGLRDCAAELLVEMRQELRALVEVEPLLDLLVPRSGASKRPSYRAYLQEFAADSPRFYARDALARRAMSAIPDSTRARILESPVGLRARQAVRRRRKG